MGLLDNIETFKQEMEETESKVKKHIKLYMIFGKNNVTWWLEVFIFIISLVINLLVLFSFVSKKNEDLFLYHGKYESFTTVMTVILIALSSICMFVWFMFNYRIYLLKEQKKYAYSLFEDKESYIESL